MSVAPDALAALWDKTCVADLVHRYAESTDSRDLDTLRGVFVDDATARYQGFDEFTDADSLVAWMTAHTADFDWQHHLLVPSEVRVEGDSASVTVYHTSHQTGAELPGGLLTLVGIYQMRARRDQSYDLGWRLSHIELAVGVRK